MYISFTKSNKASVRPGEGSDFKLYLFKTLGYFHVQNGHSLGAFKLLPLLTELAKHSNWEAVMDKAKSLCLFPVSPCTLMLRRKSQKQPIRALRTLGRRSRGEKKYLMEVCVRVGILLYLQFTVVKTDYSVWWPVVALACTGIWIS